MAYISSNMSTMYEHWYNSNNFPEVPFYGSPILPATMTGFITMTSWLARWRLKSPASRLFTQSFIQGTDQRKHQSSALLAFVRGIHRWPVNSPHKGPVTRKMFPFDDVIMYLEYIPLFVLLSSSYMKIFLKMLTKSPSDFYSMWKNYSYMDQQNIATRYIGVQYDSQLIDNYEIKKIPVLHKRHIHISTSWTRYGMLIVSTLDEIPAIYKNT